MILAVLLLLTGLTISAVAIYYSVLGLAAIFSAAVIPIIVMGSSLEVAKLVCASWLKSNWERAPWFIKSYMLSAVLVLMLITSMGIFGFLSKAHSDQNLVSGDVQSKIVLIDEKIKIERENIANAQAVIRQMDEAVTGISAKGSEREIKLRDGSTYTRSAAEQALQVRRSQAKDRDRLTKEIETAQAKIIKLQEEAAPIRAEMRKVEAEVGPIKYIAKFVYGDNPDTNILEKAVTWVIIVIVAVFDPLAVIMLLAAQMTFGWLREQKEQNSHTPDPYVADVGEKPTEEEKDDFLPTYEEITPKDTEPVINEQTHPYLYKGGFHDRPEGFKSVPPQVYTPPKVTEIDDTQPRPEFKVEAVVEYVPAEPPITADRTDHTVDESEPTYKILPELEEESKKKDLHLETGDEPDQEREVEYVQNDEQSEQSIWQKIQRMKGLKAIDQLYKQYSLDRFQGISTEGIEDRDLKEFILEVQTKGPRFSNYDPETLENYAANIYELRKNQSNNSAR